MTTRLACLLALAAGCASGTEDLAPDGTVQPSKPGKTDGFCPIVPAGMSVTEPASFLCLQPDAASAVMMADINRFWGSSIQLCACGPDFPNCEAAEARSGGWVYANVAFVNNLRTTGSDMPSQYVYAHEVGHEIQAFFNVLPSLTQPKELMADCLAGYYLGSLVCRGTATLADVTATLQTACVIADGTGDPIADLGTHGTCQQRAASVARGMDAYLQGQAALAACL